MIKNPPAMQEPQGVQVWSLSWEDPLEKEMATHFSILAWRIPQTEESGGLQSMGLQESVMIEILTHTDTLEGFANDRKLTLLWNRTILQPLPQSPARCPGFTVLEEANGRENSFPNAGFLPLWKLDCESLFQKYKKLAINKDGILGFWRALPSSGCGQKAPMAHSPGGNPLLARVPALTVYGDFPGSRLTLWPKYILNFVLDQESLWFTHLIL